MNKNINLDNIPKQKSHYYWSLSIGCSCEFEYGRIKGILTILNYKTDNKNGFIQIKYNDITGWISTSSFKRCQLGEVLKLFTHDFHYQIGDILHCKTDIKILDRLYITKNDRQRKLYTYQCLSCQLIHQTLESQLDLLHGCPYCSGKLIKIGINDITTLAPWMIGFFESVEQAQQYTPLSTVRIFPKCPVCGRKLTKEKAIWELYRSHTSGCICDTYMSFPEQIMFNLLVQNDIYFIHRATKKNLSWALHYEYDFYLPQLNTIIEMHGALHYEEHGFNTLGGKTLEEELINDENKLLLAQQQAINYFIIDCRKSNLDFILTNIKKSNLLDFLDIQIINKDLLLINSLNILKEKLKLLLSKNTFTKTQLANQLDISLKTLNYLLEIIIQEEEN